MTIMLPRNARQAAETPRVRVVPPAEVWEPNVKEVSQKLSKLGRSNCAQNVRTLSAESMRRRVVFEQQPSGFGVQKVRTHNDPAFTHRDRREHVHQKARLEVPFSPESAAAAKRDARAERMQNLIAGSVFGLLLAAGIALFAPSNEMDAPVPATVVPNGAITQVAQ